MTIAAPPRSVLTRLRGCKDKAAILDRSRAQQHAPMGVAGRHGKDRGNRQKIGTGLRQRTIKVRKTYIIANAHAEPAPRDLDDDGAVARPVGVAFPIAFTAWQIDIEHVDLIVARDDPAGRIDKKGPVR